MKIKLKNLIMHHKFPMVLSVPWYHGECMLLAYSTNGALQMAEKLKMSQN